MTQLTKQEKLNRFRAEPLARIDSPLKYIASKSKDVVQNAKGEWVVETNPQYYVAAELSRTGQGAKLQRMAQGIFYKNLRA